MAITEKNETEVSNHQIERLAENMKRVDELSKRLVKVMAKRGPRNAALEGPNPEIFAQAVTSYWTEAMQNPAKIIEQQIDYWSNSLLHFVKVQQTLAKGKLEASDSKISNLKDRRFSNPLWDQHPFFNFVKQQYLINSQALKDAVTNLEGLEKRDRHRLTYFTKQIIDMMSPTNFLATNPDVLERALETEGESLISGLENLISDLEANDGELVIKLADENAFEPGVNIATTPGKVVYRNRMMELIQYEPVTDVVYETPLVLFPPWINKYYILDLKTQNSLIRWVVEQGYTLFIVSWVNPDDSYAQVGMEEYIEEGYLAAIREIKEITNQSQVNAVGYCIAGTTLSLTLSLLKKRDDSSVKSATFFTALTDFSDQGEFTPFLDDDFINAIEEEVREKGVLPFYIMARTFSFLRSNDLVYAPVIRNYMMGETPPAFDLLYWNGDGSNLPATMLMQYLHGLCRRNEFTQEGFELFGEMLHICDVDIPIYSVTCETDHIAKWTDCYRGIQMMGSNDKTFVVSESGHIAGIINPPSKNKYNHYTNDDLTLSSSEWMTGADCNEGSWWPRWEKWLKSRSGRNVPARFPGDSQHTVLADAPGTYVMIKARQQFN
ncbi:MAG: class I poly(R)-hydroxyalkanoic acid synthase [Aestuariivita sp.]|nr:class I poly(R)-hydroxyalkanoic acid synthase [Aestuariivita sp.]